MSVQLADFYEMLSGCGRCEVRIDGRVMKLPDDDTAAIWRGLSHEAQLLHSASCQDDVIASKQVTASGVLVTAYSSLLTY